MESTQGLALLSPLVNLRFLTAKHIFYSLPAFDKSRSIQSWCLSISSQAGPKSYVDPSRLGDADQLLTEQCKGPLKVEISPSCQF